MTKKIYEDEKRVVYLREEPPGESWVFYHQKVDGKEIIPRGYLLGDNSLRVVVAPKPEQA